MGRFTPLGIVAGHTAVSVLPLDVFLLALWYKNES